MQLCDKEIYREMARAELLFAGTNPNFPFIKERQVQPASVDLRLGAKIMRFKDGTSSFDIKELMNAGSYYTEKRYQDGDPIEIGPHEVIFGQIYEQIYLSNSISASVRGRSRIARLGLSVHCTGDYINPGFAGNMPLQIINHNAFPVIIYPFVEICQVVLYRLSGPPLVPYRERLDVAYASYFNGTSLDTAPDKYPDASRNHIAESRIRKLVANYYAKEEWAYRTSHPDSVPPVNHKEQKITIQNATVENLKYLFEEGDHMRDQFNAGQAGIQGPGSGERAAVFQHYNSSGQADQDLQQLQQELELIKTYLRGNFSDDEHVIADANVSTASKLLREKRTGEALEILKKSGKLLLGIAEKIGCSVVASYLSHALLP